MQTACLKLQRKLLKNKTKKSATPELWAGGPGEGGGHNKKFKMSEKTKSKVKINVGAIITEPGSTIKTKTGNWRMFKPVWDIKKCTQCMTCWMYCPDMAIPEKNGKRLGTNMDYCKGCGICAKVCPFKAIKMVKEEK